jgi:DNA-binding transcriptional LysR family regulator
VDVEMRHLRALVAVGEELNFTRAAERLHLTQQALSGQIRQLEERVGTKLVDRDTRRVELTAAGAALYEQARPLLADAQQAIATARAAGDQRPRLTVGYIAALTHRLIAPTMRAFEQRHPDVEVSIHFGDFLDPWGGLRDNSADVAILYGEFDQTGIDLKYLFSEPRGCALAAGHPLTAKQELTIEDYTAEPLVDVPMIDPVCWAFWRGDRHRHGVPPRIGATVRSIDGLIEAIGAGLGVTGTVAFAVDALGSAAGVVFRPVAGLEPLDFYAARRTGDEREPVLAFMDTAANAQTEATPPTLDLA